MRSFVTGLLTASLAALSFSAMGCSSADTATTADSVSESADSLVVTSAYFRLESKNADGSYVVSLANGGNIECPGTGTTRKCTVPSLVVPADCDFECTDGLLSLRGISIVRGVLASVVDTTTHKRIGRLTAASGFDTFDGTLGTYPIYKVAQKTVVCKKAPCASTIQVTKLNAPAGATPTTVTSVDFSTSHDPNYVLDATRGLTQMTRPEGLLATGTISYGVFHADRVWRQWTPVADCDVLGAARATWFHTPGSDEVNLEFPTTLAAESYHDAKGRQVNWLVKTSTDANKVSFTGGMNDLWAETFDVSTTSCAVTVTGEH